jgi:XTP/dITP diphosphohydrolase
MNLAMQPRRQVVLATENPGKVLEFNETFSGCNLEIVAQSKLGVPSVQETGLSFVENALIKARQAALWTGLPALADDSGLEVGALDGAPGIYSARFAGEGAGDAAHVHKLLHDLAHQPIEKRSARYQCVLVYMRHAKDPTPLIAQASWEGVIAFEPQGLGGFGYDPVFWLPQLGVTAAQLSKEDKNQRSHRAQAVQQMLRLLRALD